MPKKRTVNVILDTNWYIRASINRQSRRTLYDLLTHPNVQIIFAKEILREYDDVISRQRFQSIISKAQELRFINLVLPRLKEVSIVGSIDLSRDSKDNYLLALARESHADYLVTGDRDLLVLENVGSTKIVGMSIFLRVLDRI